MQWESYKTLQTQAASKGKAKLKIVSTQYYEGGACLVEVLLMSKFPF